MDEKKIRLEISDDKMQVFITIPADEKYFGLKETDLVKILQSNGVVFGILEEEIKKVIAHKMYDRKVLVAQGRTPQNGTDATVEYRFKPEVKLSDLMAAKGEDLRLFEMNYIQPVMGGQEIAAKQPSTEGTEGIRVTGGNAQVAPSERGKEWRELSLPEKERVSLRISLSS